MAKHTHIKLFKPGTLIIPEIGFWLNINSAAWKIRVENPSAKLRPLIRDADKMLLGALLDEAHVGLVLLDEIEEFPYQQVLPPIFWWEHLLILIRGLYSEQVVRVRKTTLLFGQRKAVVEVNESLLESTLSISNQAWKVVSNPKSEDSNE